jgi:hypothetical protein
MNGVRPYSWLLGAVGLHKGPALQFEHGQSFRSPRQTPWTTAHDQRELEVLKRGVRMVTLPGAGDGPG